MSAVSPEFPSASASPTAGAILAAARRAQGVETSEISSRLRLSGWQVEALENDEYDRLPGTTFIRGIIRNYAKTLQIDPQPALDAYGRLAPQPAGMTINVPSQNIRFEPGAATDWSKPVKLGLLLLALAVIGGGVGLWYTIPAAPTKEADPVEARPQIAEPAPALVQPAPVEIPAPTPTDAISGPASAVLPTPALQISSSPSIAPAPSEAALRFSFQQPAWVEVKDSKGAILLSQLNPAGSEQTLTGKPPFALIIGNAASVRLVYNGNPVDLTPHIVVSVARLSLQ